MVFIVIWIAAVVVAVILGNRKGRPGLGWVMGILLGWIGVIVMACASPTREQQVLDAREQQRIEHEARYGR